MTFREALQPFCLRSGRSAGRRRVSGYLYLGDHVKFWRVTEECYWTMVPYGVRLFYFACFSILKSLEISFLFKRHWTISFGVLGIPWPTCLPSMHTFCANTQFFMMACCLWCLCPFLLQVLSQTLPSLDTQWQDSHPLAFLVFLDSSFNYFVFNTVLVMPSSRIPRFTSFLIQLDKFSRLKCILCSVPSWFCVLLWMCACCVVGSY